MKRQRLGDILLSMGALDAMQLQSALAHQQQWGTPLGRAVVEKRFCSADQVLEALSRQTGLAKVDLDQEQLQPGLGHVLSRKVCEQHRMVPLRVEGARAETLVVAIAAPATLAALDAARAVSRKSRVVGVVASDGAIDRAIERLFGNPFAGAAGATQPLRFDEIANALAFYGAPVPERAVVIYGWPELAAQHLQAMLEKHEIACRIAGAVEVAETDGEDVIVAPIPAMETLAAIGTHVAAKWIAAGKNPETDLPRARRLGAKGFLLAPVDAALLVRAIHRCKAMHEEPAAVEHGAA